MDLTQLANLGEFIGRERYREAQREGEAKIPTENSKEFIVADKDRNAERDRLEKIALLAEIIGAFAVVVSVVYLAFQISDNTRILRSQAHFNALELAQRPIELMVETADLAEVLVACNDEPFAASATNWLRCQNYYFMQFNAWEYLYYQNIDDAVPPQVWSGADAYFTDVARTKAGYARFWKELAISFDEPFRSYADAQVGMNPSFKSGAQPN